MTSATRDSQWIPRSRLHGLFRDRLDEVWLIREQADDRIWRRGVLLLGQLVHDALHEAELLPTRQSPDGLQELLCVPAAHERSLPRSYRRGGGRTPRSR